MKGERKSIITSVRLYTYFSHILGLTTLSIWIRMHIESETVIGTSVISPYTDYVIRTECSSSFPVSMSTDSVLYLSPQRERERECWTDMTKTEPHLLRHGDEVLVRVQQLNQLRARVLGRSHAHWVGRTWLRCWRRF